MLQWQLQWVAAAAANQRNLLAPVHMKAITSQLCSKHTSFSNCCRNPIIYSCKVAVQLQKPIMHASGQVLLYKTAHGHSSSLQATYAEMKVLGANCGASARVKHVSLHSRNGSQRLAKPCRSSSDDHKASVAAALPKDDNVQAMETDSARTKRAPKRQAESTDAVATFLTRRFGLAGGLAWLGFLAVGTLGEQIKTRLEVANEEAGKREVTDAVEVTLPSGVKYTDLRIGGGQTPTKGYLVVIDYVGRANGEVFEDTRARGKPIVYRWGGRPFVAGLCEGVEQGMADMRAGGKRIIKVPPQLGFGDAGAVLRGTLHAGDKNGQIPPNATLEYGVEVLRISIPPS